MNKIRTLIDARTLVAKMMQNPELQIILGDDIDANCVMSVAPHPESDIWCKMTFIDSVNGRETHRSGYIVEARRAIWESRKNVNRLNDLENL